MARALTRFRLLGSEAVEPDRSPRPQCHLRRLARSPPVHAVKGVSFDARHAARRWRWSARAAPASRSPRCRCCSCCPIRPRATVRRAASASTARSWSARAERALQQVRGNRIAMVFQEPMTSLNPLHTLEQQIAEILLLHKQHLGGGGARAAPSNCCAWSGCRDAEKPARRLSAPALGRPAPAGHDRDGARQRARPADRRRADHRARRHHPGADPAICCATCSDRLGMALLLITHDLAIVRQMAERVCVMTEGEIVEAGRDRGDLRPARSIPIPGACWPPSRRAAPRRPTRRAGAGRGRARSRCGSRSAAGCCAGRRARQGGRRRLADACAPAHTLGVVGESGSGKTTLGLALLRARCQRGRDPLRGRATSHATCAAPAAAAAARDADRLPGPVCSACRRASRSAQIVGEGLRGARASAATDAERRRLIADGARRGRARSRRRRPLPARVLRRPAPAHRHRPRPGAEAALRGARRADLGARHVGAGADRRSAARPAGAPRPRLPVHQPRPARWCARWRTEIIVMKDGEIVEAGRPSAS